MDSSVGLAIEKIKIIEQDKETKLKEKREYDASVALLQRNVRDITIELEKLREEQNVIDEKNLKLIKRLQKDKIRKHALTDQLETLKVELQKLKTKVNNDICKVWEIRASFCKTVQKTSDEYSVWALLMKPVNNDFGTLDRMPKYNSATEQDENKLFAHKNKMQAAIERRNNAIEKRNFLSTEPEKGEEFLRIKNALRYSLEKISSLKR